MCLTQSNADDGATVSRFLNEHLVGIVRQHPQRFRAFGTLPMQAPESAAAVLRKAALDYGSDMVGFEIGSHINEWNLSARELDPIWHAAQEADKPIFVHPWDMQQGGRFSQYWMPWLVGMPAETTGAICALTMGGVLERFPRLRFCFAHGAGSYPYTIGRIDHGFRTRPDLCAIDCERMPSSYCGRLWADSLVHSESALRLLLDALGEERVMLGTDYPFVLGEHQAGRLVEGSTSLGASVKEKILRGNAIDYLRIDESNLS